MGQNTGHQFSVIDSGQAPSQFARQGKEDLEDSLNAESKLKSGISIANGGLGNSNGNLSGRQAWVGPEGKFGEVKAGL
jgi:predicted porin